MKTFDPENARAQMRKSLLEFCILVVISEGRIYASDILKRLTDANMIIVEGTLYPLLSRLRTEGMVEYEWEESRTGPPRKYYTLTKHGKAAVESLKESWTDLQTSISTLIK